MPEQPQQLTSIRQIKKAKLKGLIKGKKTASGEWASIVNTEPVTSMHKAYGTGRMHEETSNPAIATFGRHNPIHQGHEAIFNKMHEIAKRNNGKKYIYTSHSQNEKNPLSAEDKVKYIKKVVPSAEVRSSSRESPTILHMASHLHGEGHDELHIVVGSDRAADFEKTLNKYNGVKGPHGFYNFKKITVHSVGRDPDAEGVEGLSATKMRKAAQENDHETFRSGLPDSIKKHSKDIMNKVRSGMSIKEAIESLGITMDELFEATALNRNWSRLSPSSKERVIQAYTSDEAPKPKSSFKKFNQSIKGRLNETGGAGDIGTDELVAKYKKDTPGEYEHTFKDAFNHYLNLIMKPENKGRPWELIAGDVKKDYPNVLPLALNQKLRELIGGSDQELKKKIFDEDVDTSKIKPTEHLQNKLDAAKDTSYSAIDKIMRAVAHDYDLDVKELRSQWMKKFKKTPDDYVKEAFNYTRYMRNPNRAPAKPLSQKSLDIIDKAANEIGKKAVPSQQAIQDRKTKTRADYEKEIPESLEVTEAKKPRSLLSAMEKLKPGVGKRMDAAAAALKQNAADYQAILDKEKKKEVSEAVWDQPNPKKKHKKLSPAQKARAKARARAAGRPYPNLVDNMAVAREEVEIVTEISNELIGKVNKIRSLYGPKSKTSAAERTREKAVEKVRRSSKVGKVEENFMDGKNPQDKGDMARHGLKGKSISELKKIRSSKNASPRKKQLAHWYINMHKKD